VRPETMLRVFLVALVFVALASASIRDVEQFPQSTPHFNEIDNAGALLGDEWEFFCHSYCTFWGKYNFQRFWAESNPDLVDETKIFDWSGDGSLDFWTSDISSQFDGDTSSYNCDDVLEYFRYAPKVAAAMFTEENLRNCQPEWIYIEGVEIFYERDDGLFHWTHSITDSFIPSDLSWTTFSDIAYRAKTQATSIGDDPTLDFDYDNFDGLLRYYPESDDSRLTDKYNDDYYYSETYVANYEPNYCTMQMPHSKIDSKLWCNGNIIDDSDNVDYPTREYCLARNAWKDEGDTYYFGCGIADSDDCDSVYFQEDTSRSAKRSLPAPKPSKTERLRQATSNHKNLAKFEKREATPVSNFSPPGLFYYQNFVAGVQFPFCAVKTSF